MSCTWEGCVEVATHSQIGKDGSEWANLCHYHNKTLETTLFIGDPKMILGNWIRAQGGSKLAAEKMKPEAEVGVKFVKALQSLQKFKPLPPFKVNKK